MANYEIRYMHDDNSLALIYKTTCSDDETATWTAKKMMPKSCARYEIWTDANRVETWPEMRPAA